MAASDLSDNSRSPSSNATAAAAGIHDVCNVVPLEPLFFNGGLGCGAGDLLRTFLPNFFPYSSSSPLGVCIGH